MPCFSAPPLLLAGSFLVPIDKSNRSVIEKVLQTACRANCKWDDQIVHLNLLIILHPNTLKPVISVT